MPQEMTDVNHAEQLRLPASSRTMGTSSYRVGAPFSTGPSQLPSGWSSGHGVGGGGDTSAKFAGDVEPWRQHLAIEATRVARAVKKRVAEEHRLVSQTNRKLNCGLCGMENYPLDLVSFMCTQHGRSEGAAGQSTTTNHRFCTTCLSGIIKEQERNRNRIRCAESAAVLRDVSEQCSRKVHLVVCPICHCPNAVIAAVCFHETFNRERIDSRIQFSVHVGATQVIAENFVVERHCENQRRPFFGAFSEQNLLVVDFCGTHSTEQRFAASEIESLQQTFARPNSSWAWLEDWTPDLRLNPKGGWRYSRDFTKEWPAAWGRDAAMLMFVRRRRMLRVRVRFNAEVRGALLGYFANDVDAGDAEP